MQECYTSVVIQTIEMVKRGGERRRRTEQQKAIREQVESHMARRMFTTPGAEAAERWRLALGLSTVPRWFVEITIAAEGGARFDLQVYGEEWGFTFAHGGRTSWIRVTDVPFAHGRDEHGLLDKTPDLLAVHALLAQLERDHGLVFRLDAPSVRTNLPDVENPIRDWLVQPPPYTTVKQTVELCGNEMHAGIRCTLSKGHNGDHEYQDLDGRGQLRWK